MRRGTRKFTGASAMIAIVPVYARGHGFGLGARRARGRRFDSGPMLCGPLHGLDRARDAADQTDGKTRSGDVTSSVRFIIKPHPTRGSAANQPAGQ